MQAGDTYYPYTPYQYPHPLGLFPPTIGAASVISASSISVAFTPDATGEATNYKVQRSPDNSTWADDGTITASPYISTGLSANTLYYYRVAGWNGTSAGTYSASASATTSASTVSLKVLRNPATLGAGN
jgi:hypothetical protein